MNRYGRLEISDLSSEDIVYYQTEIKKYYGVYSTSKVATAKHFNMSMKCFLEILEPLTIEITEENIKLRNKLAHEKMLINLQSRYGKGNNGDKISQTKQKRTEKQKKIEIKKQKQTIIEKYGTFHNKGHDVQIARKNTHVKITLNGNKKWITKDEFLDILDNYPENKRFKTKMFKELGLSLGTFNDRLQRWYPDYKFTKNEIETSQAEIEIFNFLINHNFSVERNVRNIIYNHTGYGLELDLFLPELNIAIEYNGIYWHDKNNQIKEHKKSRLCEEKGIYLIHIWEDDFHNDKEKTLNYLLNEIYTHSSFSEIETIEIIESEETEDFYDIEVPDYNNFVLANDLVVHNSADTIQMLTLEGFENVERLHFEKTPEIYMNFRNALIEQRIKLLKLDNLEKELLLVERNNQTGKINHPENTGDGHGDGADACLSYDTKIFTLSNSNRTIEDLYFNGWDNEWILAFDIKTQRIKPVLIQKVIQKYIPEKLYKITLDNGECIKVTGDHLILCRTGNYKRADELKIGESLMPFNIIEQFKWKNNYRQVINPITKDKKFIYKLVFEELAFKKAEYENLTLQKPDKYKLIHHINHNKLNDNPDNLIPIGNVSHNNLHRDLLVAYNKSDKHRERVFECNKLGISGWQKVDKENPEKMLQIRKENRKKQAAKWNGTQAQQDWINSVEGKEKIKRAARLGAKIMQTEKKRKEQSLLIKHRYENNEYKEKMLNTASWKVYNKRADMKEKQKNVRILNVYNLVKANTNLFDTIPVKYSEYLLTIRYLRDIGKINNFATGGSTNFNDYIKLEIPLIDDISPLTLKQFYNKQVTHERQLKKAKELYNLLLENTDVISNYMIYEDVLNGIEDLKAKGILNKHYTCKPKYEILIEAGFIFNNHKIINIEIIDNKKPVYDLVLNEIHNFGICAGIYVHNCAGAYYNAMLHESEYSDTLTHLHMLSPADGDIDKEQILKIAAGVANLQYEEQLQRNAQHQNSQDIQPVKKSNMSNWIL